MFLDTVKIHLAMVNIDVLQYHSTLVLITPCQALIYKYFDIKIWHWMYDHPNASPEQLNEAILSIAKQIWNKYFAPVLGMEDQILLAVYSHIIDAGMYTPDYPLGYIIQFQIEQYFKNKNLATEMERMCKLGSITPDAWMVSAVGAPISTEPLVKAVQVAVKKLNSKQ